MSKRSFLKGAAVLALAGVIVRIIGALYRIPLTNILGEEGVGLYQLAYPVYGLLLTLSTAGIPGAISKMVSERMVHQDRRNALRVFHISLIFLSIIGLISAVAMALGSSQIAAFIARGKGPMAVPSMLAAAPALFFVAIITAYRGYFQGLQHMTPTAISQIWEQAIKIIPGFFIAAQLNKINVSLGAAGAMWGVVLSEIVALVYLMMVFAKKKRKQAQDDADHVVLHAVKPNPPEPFWQVSSKLARLALPMMAGAIFLPLASLADAAIVMNRLTDLGYDPSAALALFGILSGMVNVLVNVPGVLSLSLSTSLIPAIAESKERKDMRAVERKSRVGLRMTMLVSVPSAVGLAVLARPVMALLYGPSLSPEGLTIGAGLLVTSSISVIFLSIVQSTNGTLQGLGRVYVPMISLAIGALVKIALNYTLVGIQSIRIFGTTFEVNIHGAPIGTIVCYLIPSVINLVFLIKATGIRLDMAGMLIRPGLASAAMGLAALAISTWLPAYTGGKIATVLAVLAAIPVYVVFAILIGAIGREELSFMPGGSKLAAFLDRYRLLRG